MYQSLGVIEITKMRDSLLGMKRPPIELQSSQSTPDDLQHLLQQPERSQSDIEKIDAGRPGNCVGGSVRLLIVREVPKSRLVSLQRLVSGMNQLWVISELNN